MADNKTNATEVSVAEFIDSVPHAVRRADAQVLDDLFQRVTGWKPRMWGPTIIGYGSYDYTYESGRTGTSLATGFSPRKANMVLYLIGGYMNPKTKAKMDVLREKLGKHKVGKSCLYIGRLSNVDTDVLAELIKADLVYMDEKYPR